MRIYFLDNVTVTEEVLNIQLRESGYTKDQVAEILTAMSMGATLDVALESVKR